MFEEFDQVLIEDEMAAKANVLRDLIKNARRTREYAEEEIASFENRVREELDGRFTQNENGLWMDHNMGDDDISGEEKAKREASHIRDEWRFDDYRANKAKVVAIDALITKLSKM